MTAVVAEEWVMQLEGGHLAELDAAINAAACVPTHEVAQNPPSTPSLSALLNVAAKEVDEGAGFCVLRGFDASRYSELELRAALTIVGAHFGVPISQNMYGDMMCSVRQTGRKLGEPGVRGYDTDSELRFHNDECDIIGLLCIQPAKSGGRSSVAGSAAIHETMQEEAPELLRVLERGYTFSLMGEERPGVGPVSDHLIPVFSTHEGKVSCRYTLNTIYQANRVTGVALTAEEQAALDKVLEIARRPGMHVTFDLQAGDMQFCNNLSTLHARTSFEDYEDPARWRHLLRIWLRSHHPRPLSPEFEQRFNGGWSFRRGIPVSRPRT